MKTIEDRWVNIKIVDDENKKYILVSNNGPKINESIADKIFEPLFTTKLDSGGMGMGLSISKKIMDKFKGDLELDTENINTCFKMTMEKQDIEGK